MANVEGSPGEIKAKAPAGEPVTSPDPVALSLSIVKRCRGRGRGPRGAGHSAQPQTQLGGVATWTLAITTPLAFLAAGFAGLVAYQLLKIEASRG
jgi:hypothetical protein